MQRFTYLVRMGAVLQGWRAEPLQGLGHRHLQRVHTRAARPLLLMRVLYLPAQQAFHIVSACTAYNPVSALDVQHLASGHASHESGSRVQKACIVCLSKRLSVTLLSLRLAGITGCFRCTSDPGLAAAALTCLSLHVFQDSLQLLLGRHNSLFWPAAPSEALPK